MPTDGNSVIGESKRIHFTLSSMPVLVKLKKKFKTALKGRQYMNKLKLTCTKNMIRMYELTAGNCDACLLIDKTGNKVKD